MTSGSSDNSAQILALLPLINKTVISVADLKEFGYTKTQLLIFISLYRCKNLTMSEIARCISSSKEQATRAVAPLVDDGLMERYIDSINRTRIHIRLTPKGTEFLEQYKNRVSKNLNALMCDAITSEEISELNQAADTLIRILTKLK